jgi:hypothetical protein
VSRPAIVFANLTVARKFRDDIDADFGYPQPNIVVPGGTLAPVGQTTGYASLIKHPTRNQWAYPDEPIVRGMRGRVPIPGGGGSRVDLDTDPTWEGAEPASLVRKDA